MPGTPLVAQFLARSRTTGRPYIVRPLRPPRRPHAKRSCWHTLRRRSCAEDVPAKIGAPHTTRGHESLPRATPPPPPSISLACPVTLGGVVSVTPAGLHPRFWGQKYLIIVRDTGRAITGDHTK